MAHKLQLAATFSVATIIAVTIKLVYDHSAQSVEQKQDARIKELQAALVEQRNEYEVLKQKYNKAEQRSQQIKTKYNRSSSVESQMKAKLKALQNEKRHVFMTMMSGKKKLAHLEDTQDALKLQLDSYQRQLQQYKLQIAEYNTMDKSIDADDSTRTDQSVDADDAKDIQKQ